jgi:hypothetical protein
MNKYENSNLWKTKLANQGHADSHEKARERLRQAFERTRDKIEPLVALISKQLPGLTVHDITHLDEMWNIADTLIDENFNINPTEAFVLGMAFLLHDSACSTYAYSDGIDGLKKSLEWRDFVAQNNFSEVDMQPGKPGYQKALFETLRLLHPQQAEKLLSQSWPDLNQQPRYLMDDIELRNHYGRDIGKIAASHGKDAAIVERDWANSAPLTPHSCLGLDSNTDWKVDRLKIALLLRCVDAAHIDSLRAPDMLASLIKPSGESLNHWLFQNRLGALSINTQNYLYWSGQTFEEKDSDAWWCCFNTVKMIDNEIRVANRILKNNGRNELRAKGVSGAQDISVFLQNVPVQGWQPIDIDFQISRVGDVIEKFGGAKLYGDDPRLAMRELIQNAADAIRARRLYRDKPELGRIDISMTENTVDGTWWLHVQDNGIGMSRYVLTEVLLDFGRSLWSDSALRQQWKGLAGKHFEAVGQFGIGFFAVFMLGEEIKVTTWRDGDAEETQVTLHIRENTLSRPTLLDTLIDQRLCEYGTRVSVRLQNGRETILRKYFSGGINKNLQSKNTPDIEMTLSQVVGVLAPALDIDVWCQDGRNQKVKAIEANDWMTIKPVELLQRIGPLYTESNLIHHLDSFFDIKETDGSLMGRASIGGNSIGPFGMNFGVLVYKGISVGRCNMCGIFVSSNNIDLARSIAKPICSSNALTSWAEEVSKAKRNRLNPDLSNKLLSLGVSPSNLPVAVLSQEYLTPEDLKCILKHDIDEIVFALESPECPESIARDVFNTDFELNNNVIFIWHTYRREDFGLNEWINSLIPHDDSHPRDIQSVIEHCVMETWPNASSSYQQVVIGNVLGEEIDTECLVFQKN